MSDAKPMHVQIPAGGKKITISNGKLDVPDQPIIPFIEVDGTGRDIWRGAGGDSTRRYKKPTAASARFTGWKCSPARKRIRRTTLGCRTKRSLPAATT